MALGIGKQNVPLESDADRVVRVSGTRVTLDTVVAAFEEGASAEEIVQQYPSLSLADVYAVIGYYLHHREEVNEYLSERLARREELRSESTSKQDARGIRERQLKRGIQGA